MAPIKKTKASPKVRSSGSKEPSLKKVKGENFYRNAKQVSRLKMLSGGKAIRDKDGKIIQAAAFQKGEDETKPGRVQPDRRWFGNTRVISQTALDHFRTSLSTKKDDPYSVLLRRNKLPMALLDDASNPNTRKRSHIVETEPFSETFGPKAQRKKARIDVGTFEELTQSYEVPELQTHADYIEPIFAKGTSRRIYGELYKVIDSSDYPLGTMCESVLEYMKKEKAHKQVVLVINKCDLVPNWVTARYIQHLTPRYPTIAFHASPNHSFGKGSLIQLLRQFSQLHSDKKQISVGFVGYPNVGKSSVINTLKSGKVCRVAPVPGETKVWQYITLTRRIYLIDCPGVVPTSAHDSQTSTVLKGVLRVEALPVPSEHIPALMSRVKPLYLSRTYGVALPDPDDPSRSWDPEQFLDTLARMKGRLLKGGEPDVDGVAKIILSDWVRGRIPFFVPPPERSEELNKTEAKVKARSKGKAKAVDGGTEVLAVKQNLKTITQKNTFLAEDVQPLDEDDSEDEEISSTPGDHALDLDEEDEGSELGSDENNEDEVEELSWNDVFNDGKEPASEAVEDNLSSAEQGMVSFCRNIRRLITSTEPTHEDEQENFYTNTNVKNKSRNKAAVMKSLPVGKKGEGRKRR
ncbi:NGP1NT-domain-containing protein [Suillus variegatus]|nr:NGP1NT-domain-containing protein [Suillus variegatus]